METVRRWRDRDGGDNSMQADIFVYQLFLFVFTSRIDYPKMLCKYCINTLLHITLPVTDNLRCECIEYFFLRKVSN